MTDPNPVVAALLASGRRELAQHRVTQLRKPNPTPTKDTAVSHADTPTDDPLPAGPHRITFLASASTTVDIPDTGQGREEAIENAYDQLDTSLCWRCSSKVDLGDFEAEEDSYDPTAEMRATLDALRALANQWVAEDNGGWLAGQQIEDGRAVLAILDGQETPL